MSRGADERVNSLVKGLEVLKAFGRHHQPMNITEVASETGLTPASARRMLLTLTGLGYVEKDGRRFRVGPKVLDLGYSYLASMPLWQITQPAIERLSETLKISTAVAVLDGCEIVFTVRASTKHVSSVLVSTGTRQPAHVTSMGRVLLAFLTPEQLNATLSLAKFERYTDKSLTDESKLRSILEEVRLQNYAIVDSEWEPGLRAIAVPIRNKRGDVVAAMNAAVYHSPLDGSYLKEHILPAMFETAAQIRVNLPN